MKQNTIYVHLNTIHQQFLIVKVWLAKSDRKKCYKYRYLPKSLCKITKLTGLSAAEKSINSLSSTTT